jgi:dTMP kinase
MASNPPTHNAALDRAERGLFIVVEGLDKAGKSTQCSKLARNLEMEGHRTEILRFPDRNTAVGNLIDMYLKGQTPLDDHVAHLLFSANRWESE